MKLYQLVIVMFLFFVNSISFAFCQDVTLSWDPSPTSGVDGYKVYYKQGNMTPPFDGIGADQGASPVDVGDTLSTMLTGLSDGVTYFFTVTAYQDPDSESSFSNIVSNSWIPSLTIPTDNTTAEPVPVTFRWETAPSGYDVTYTLFYGTDEAEVTSATSGILPPPWGNNLIPTGLILVLIVGLLTQIEYGQIMSMKPVIKPAYTFLAVILAGGILTACGGGGGGGSSSDRSATSTETPVTESVLYSIDKGSSDYHQAFDLTGSTTYFWKVVATDTRDPNLTYESEVRSFTTEVF
ncbi:fibronectin type III domain-containing protein [uncultured Desulfuromusa sp.]|uniref:fibronectin type III domain-containing protein n=1 Tax=uncultured Desulfuromusa sp. TaxID=219183 RepID=UPI002AA8B959|nr:fibronectin type III domain-containing protein [uncultured Desulfuromusa sp.]